MWVYGLNGSTSNHDVHAYVAECEVGLLSEVTLTKPCLSNRGPSIILNPSSNNSQAHRTQYIQCVPLSSLTSGRGSWERSRVTTPLFVAMANKRWTITRSKSYAYLVSFVSVSNILN